MLPTGRDVETLSEIRNHREQQAAEWRVYQQLTEQDKTNLPAIATALARLGDWMIVAGGKLRSRYGDVGPVDSQLRSLEQGC